MHGHFSSFLSEASLVLIHVSSELWDWWHQLSHQTHKSIVKVSICFFKKDIYSFLCSSITSANRLLQSFWVHAFKNMNTKTQRNGLTNPYSTVIHSQTSQQTSQNDLHYPAHTQIYTGFLCNFCMLSHWEKRKLQMVLFPSSDSFVAVKATPRKALECKSYYVPAVYALAQQPLKKCCYCKKCEHKKTYDKRNECV